MRLNRRDLLMGAAAFWLAACGPRNPQSRALELWTLQLAPKFNPYFADVLGAWSRLHPGAPVTMGVPFALSRRALHHIISFGDGHA